MKVRKFATAGAAVGLLSTSASGQAPAPAPTNVIKWTLDWQEPYCTVSIGSPDALGLSVWAVPGGDEADLYLIGKSPELASIRSSTVKVALLPSGAPFEPTIERFKGSGRAVVKLTKLDREFVDAFRAARAIRVETPLGPLAVPILGAGKASAALDLCVDEVLKGWGVDTVAQRSLKKLPKNADGYGFMRGSDYPDVAVNMGKSATVVARLNVDAAGQITNCTVVQNDSLEAFGNATCKAALTRGKFHPAIGADGKPAAAELIRRVHFRLL